MCWDLGLKFLYWGFSLSSHEVIVLVLHHQCGLGFWGLGFKCLTVCLSGILLVQLLDFQVVKSVDCFFWGLLSGWDVGLIFFISKPFKLGEG